MTWELVETADGQYAVDWDIVGNVIRQYELAKLKMQSYTTVDISQSNWYNPFSWSLPKIVNIDIDWKAVRSATELNSFIETRSFGMPGRNRCAGKRTLCSKSSTEP